MDNQFNADKIITDKKHEEYEQSLKDRAAVEARAEAELKGKQDQERIEKEKQDAIHREEMAKQAQLRAEREAVEAQEREKAVSEQAKQRRKQDAINAENKRLNDIELAKQEEVSRQNEKLRLERESAKRREADKEHKAKINNGILNVLIANGISEKDAKTMVVLAVKRELPNLVINY